MKICFIDDNLRMTCKAMEGAMGYYEDRKGEKLDCTMLLVNIDGKNVLTKTKEYYKSIFDDLGIEMKEGKSLEDINHIIENIMSKDMLFLVDLSMLDGPDRTEGIDLEKEKMEKDKSYRCISMQCMDILDEKNLHYLLYSGKSEKEFKDPWQQRFRELYNREPPIIYERNALSPACFDESVAKEILGV